MYCVVESLNKLLFTLVMGEDGSELSAQFFIL